MPAIETRHDMHQSRPSFHGNVNAVRAVPHLCALHTAQQADSRLGHMGIQLLVVKKRPSNSKDPSGCKQMVGSNSVSTSIVFYQSIIMMH